MRRPLLAYALIWIPLVCVADDVIKSPKGSYIITQTLGERWSAALHFVDGSRVDAPLAADPDQYPWPASYYISPDEKWIMRIQKIGSGENWAFLYHVEPSGRVWRLEQHLDDLAFRFLATKLGIARKDFYHTGLEFVLWDTNRHLLRFTVSGSRLNESGKGIERQLAYDWQKHIIVSL
jgi:hypothetical protein